MRNATELLVQYAAYHRDRRNIASHLLGVPMIVFAVGVLLARPGFDVGQLDVTAAWIVFALAALWYLTRGLPALGIATSLGVGVLIAAAHRAADASFGVWLALGVGFFVVGWLIQFAGHWYEGRKPAFVDDLVGLLVGPMFVAAEALFAAGWNKPLQGEIERRVGPAHLRDLARIA